MKTRGLYEKNEGINISHVSLDPWFDFESNTNVREELNIFRDPSAKADGAIVYFIFSMNIYNQKTFNFKRSFLQSD